MNGKFLSNLLLLVFLNLLVKPFYILGIDATVQNTVGAESYGNYFALLNFTFLFNILLDLGLTNYNNRSVSRNARELTDSLSVLLGAKIMLCALYIFVTGTMGLVLNFSNEQWGLLVVLVFNQFLVSAILFLRSNLGALQQFKKDSLISVLDRVLLIVFCGLLLWSDVFDTFQIEYFIYAQTLAYGLTFLTAYIMVPVVWASKWPKFDISKTRIILKKSMPFALLVLLMMLYNRIDAVMLERMLLNGKSEAGIYAMAYRVLDASHMFVMLFGTLLLPIFSSMIKKKESVESLVGVSTRLMFAFVVPFVALILIFPGQILSLLYDQVDQNTIQSFRYLMIGFIGMSMTYVYGALLTANGSLRGLNIMALIGIGVNVVLNMFLIPNYGAQGAALATLITQVSTGAIQFGYARYIFKFEVVRALLVPIGILVVSVSGAAFVVEKNFQWSIGLGLMFLLVGVVCAWLSGNIHIKPFLNELKAKE